METREQLLEQYEDWMTKYMDADKRLKRLLSPLARTAKGGKLTAWVPTKESLAELEKAERDMSRTMAKLHEIMAKLYELR